MARKRLIVFYHYGKANEAIAESDYASFYTTLQNASKGFQINLIGNPIRNLPQEFLNTTSARLFNYFNDREQSQDTRNYKA